MSTPEHDASKLVADATDTKKLNRLRRLVRVQFKQDTQHDSSYRMRMMIVPHRTTTRVKIRVERDDGGLRVAHVISFWTRAGIARPYEESIIAPAYNDKAVVWTGFNPRVEETRNHAVKAMMTLLGDPIAELVLAAAKGR